MRKAKKIMVLVVLAMVCMTLCGCQYTIDKGSRWKKKYDVSAPVLDKAGASADTANGDGWYSTLLSDFDDNSLGDIWKPVNNCLRKEEYWCDKMISLSDGKVNIEAKQLSDHECENCKGKSEYYTSGIVTFDFIDGKRVPTFEQAFGYFEAKVQLPDSDGMWSAFWLNSLGMHNVGNGGTDGAEIDIYESSFYKNKSMVGNCIIYDGYGKTLKGGQGRHDTGKNLYEGYHTFGLKWSPNEYVFFVDGEAVWATDFGGVSKVPGYVLLTNEIRQKAETGPYGQKLGKFTGGTFVIDSVKIYQNTKYVPFIEQYKL